MIQDPEDSFTPYTRFIPSDNIKIILELKRTRIPVLSSVCGYLYTMGAE